MPPPTLKVPRTVHGWGVLWRTKTTSNLKMGDNHGGPWPLFFPTRREAKAYIDRHYGYIRTRKDLRGAPHHWRLPVPVRVMLTMGLDSPADR